MLLINLKKSKRLFKKPFPVIEPVKVTSDIQIFVTPKSAVTLRLRMPHYEDYFIF